ncbi:MAG TPA: hypothetical protein PLQ11_10000 [Beijerinckiaceae bacterium]|nr:hypothetical protein [Beijerinckiaceae bacterium]
MKSNIGKASADAIAKIAAGAGLAASAKAKAQGHAVTGTRMVEIDGKQKLCVVRIYPSGDMAVVKVLDPATPQTVRTSRRSSKRRAPAEAGQTK